MCGSGAVLNSNNGKTKRAPLQGVKVLKVSASLAIFSLVFYSPTSQMGATSFSETLETIYETKRRNIAARRILMC
jgi:hypothetical protein